MAHDGDRWWEDPGLSGQGPAAGPYSQPGIPQPPAGYPGQQPGAYAPPQYGVPPGYGQQAYPQQPYGQQPYGQQPYGFAPPPGPPRRGNGAGIVIAVVAVFALVVVTGIVAVVIARSGSPETSAAATSTTAPATQAAPLTGTTTAPATPGSRGVLVAAYRVAYDVPSAWTIASASETMSFSSAAGSIVGRGQAHEGEDYCPGSAYRVISGITTSTETDEAAASQAIARIAAAGGYSDASGGTLTAPTALTTTSGVTGQFVESTGPWTPRIPGCTADSYSVYTFAFYNAEGTLLVLTMLVDRGTSGELSADAARQIITSLRLV
ncbi:hypothetical protein [Nocardia rhizosphaerae]|uniref:DUF8017 domain-containing protein n=1 Tax=Nocardia rhizosphaerae TaxID=1691571 RepID=A0ABV8LCJ3_9NOCA